MSNWCAAGTGHPLGYARGQDVAVVFLHEGRGELHSAAAINIIPASIELNRGFVTLIA